MKPVIFDTPCPDYGELMTVEEFRANVEVGGYTDYDGSGQPVKDGLCARVSVRPSDLGAIPPEATHIIWYNK